MNNLTEKMNEATNNTNLKEETTMDLTTLTKDLIREKLFEDFGVVFSNTSFKRMKKDELIAEYNECVEADKIELPGDIKKPTMDMDAVIAATTAEVINRHKVCCGTGRRPKDLYGYEKNNYLPMVEKMKKAVIWFYETKDVRTFITGGAQGWDQLLFWAVNAVKRDTSYSDIKNIVYVPMKGQDFKWSADGLFGKKEYQLMLKYADEVKYITEINNTASYKEIVDAMMGRNHAMVNDSDYVFGCFPDDTWFNPATKSGTAECLRYAYNKRVDTTIMYHNTGVSKFYEFSKISK